MAHGEVAHLGGHLLLEFVDTVEEVRVALAQAYILFLEQPPGQAAHLPLGAYVWAGAQDHLHVVGLAELDKLAQVILAGEVKLALAGLVGIPERVQTHRIHAQGLAHLDALVPVLAGYTGVVELGSLYHKGLAVEQECAVAGLKSAGRVGS